MEFRKNKAVLVPTFEAPTRLFFNIHTCQRYDEFFLYRFVPAQWLLFGAVLHTAQIGLGTAIARRVI